MGQRNILSLFFDEPVKEFGLREIARLAKLPKTTASRHLVNMVKEKLVLAKKGKLPVYVANDDYFFFRFYKKFYSIDDIYHSGLISMLEEQLYPRCIILFGSFAKGEYIKKSDIDIFVQAKEKKVDLSLFERKLKHSINIIFAEDLKDLSKELFNNIINGVKLSGYIKLK